LKKKGIKIEERKRSSKKSFFPQFLCFSSIEEQRFLKEKDVKFALLFCSFFFGSDRGTLICAPGDFYNVFKR
jgi:hypothetical protein